MNSMLRAKTLNSRLIDIYAGNNIPVIDTVPRRIQIIPTLRCNYRCTMCFQSEEVHKQTEEIDFSIYEKLADVFPFVQSVYFTGGEPLMYSEMPRTLEYLSQFGISLSISTNGSLLSGKRLETAFKYMDTIKISLDAATPDTYAKIRRNGDFNKVVRNITDLMKLKITNRTQSPNINFSMVAMKSNIAELPDLVRLVHTLGSRRLRVAHAELGNSQVKMPDEALNLHQEESDHYMIEGAKIARELGVELITPSLFNPPAVKNIGDAKEAAPEMKHYDTGRCIEPWEYMLINPNGSTNMCCSNCVGEGNLYDQSFDEIWNGRVVQHLRRKLNTDDEPAACANCYTYKRGKIKKAS